MPAPSVLLIRTALAWLVVGALSGALLLASKAAALPPGIARLFHLHVEALLIGWMVQLAMGVAWWILPKYPTGLERGPVAPIWGVWFLLNLGVLVAGVGRSVSGGDLLVVQARTAELFAAMLFLASAWPRVKAFGK